MDSSVAFSGCVAGWCDLHERYGRTPLADLLAPAIAYARAGYTVTARGKHGNRFDLLRRHNVHFNLVTDDAEIRGTRPGRFGPGAGPGVGLAERLCPGRRRRAAAVGDEVFVGCECDLR